MSPESQRNRVAIVVDSAATAPDRFQDHPLTFTVPMLVHIGDQTYRDGHDLSAADFYAMQREHVGRTSTSAPTPGAFYEAFEQASKVAESILCITVSSTFSSCTAAAESARTRFLTDRKGGDVRVLDSLTAVGAEGLIAWEALKAAQTGADIDSVEFVAVEVRQRVRLLAYVDTLFYLWKGGRVPGLAHLAASVLRLKPVFELDRSVVTSIARPRTAKRAVSKLADLLKQRTAGRPVHAMVMHAQAPERAQDLAELIASELNCQELFTSGFTPVMGAHIGPGMVGVAFWSPGT